MINTGRPCEGLLSGPLSVPPAHLVFLSEAAQQQLLLWCSKDAFLISSFLTGNSVGRFVPSIPFICTVVSVRTHGYFILCIQPNTIVINFFTQLVPVLAIGALPGWLCILIFSLEHFPYSSALVRCASSSHIYLPSPGLSPSAGSPSCSDGGWHWKPRTGH